MRFFSKENDQLTQQAEAKVKPLYKAIEEIAYHNQIKVLKAFHKHAVAPRHFAATSGYGYDDIGRDTLCEVFADCFGCEGALVSPNITSGTHALTLMLFGVLRPGDTLLSVTGEPYDTLHQLICGEDIGSLKDFGVKFEKIELKDDKLDLDCIKNYLLLKKPKAIFVQRSRGYNWRNALSVEQIAELVELKNSIDRKILVLVDNCYGEFVQEIEPTDVGADLIAGSLIKNAGGGFAPTGGYIAGRPKLVELVSYRLTSPSIGNEVGSYAAGYTDFYRGLFMAPTTVSNAIKGGILMGQVMSDLGFETLPAIGDTCYDIIRSIKFKSKEQLIEFCQNMQFAAPVDSNVTPEPWDMPGYSEQVIMAAGTFVQGSSIELSADSPIKEPYIAYMQGALTYEHAKIAAQYAAESILHPYAVESPIGFVVSTEDRIKAYKLMPIDDLLFQLTENADELSERQFNNYLKILFKYIQRGNYRCETVAKAEEMYEMYRAKGYTLLETVNNLIDIKMFR